MSSPKKPSRPRAKKPSAPPRAPRPPSSPGRGARPAKPPARRPAKPPPKPSAAKPAKPRSAPKPKATPPASPASPKPLEQAGPKPEAHSAEPPSPWDLSTAAAAELLASPKAAAHFAFRQIAELSSDRPEPSAVLRQIVADILCSETKETFGHLTTDHQAAPELERYLRLHIERLREELGFNERPPTTEAAALLSEDGLLAWDARMARYLDRLGALGHEAATQMRASAKKRWQQLQQAHDMPASKVQRGAVWALWADPSASPPGGRFARLLAIVLWNDVLAPALSKRAALVAPVMGSLIDFHARGRHLETQGAREVLSFQGREIAEVDKTSVTLQASTLHAVLMARGLDLLGSLPAHKLLRWEIFEGHRRVLQGEPKASILTVEGGWTALAERLGLPPNQYASMLRDVVRIQAHFRFAFPDGSHGNLLSYLDSPAQGRRKATVTISLGAPLLPGYVHELQAKLGKVSVFARSAQRLVPMVDIPPLVGRANEHGHQASFSMALVAEMRERARELVKEGGVIITPMRAEQLAERALLPLNLVPQVLDRWTQDGDDGPAFLHRIERDRYTLGDAHASARAFLEEAGRHEVAGTQAAHRGIQLRRARLYAMAAGPPIKPIKSG